MDTSDKEPKEDKICDGEFDGVEALRGTFEAVSEAGHPELLGFTPTDEGVDITVLPEGLDEPVTVHLRVVSATVVPSEAARPLRRRFGWPEHQAEPPGSERACQHLPLPNKGLHSLIAILRLGAYDLASQSVQE